MSLEAQHINASIVLQRRSRDFQVITAGENARVFLLTCALNIICGKFLYN